MAEALGDALADSDGSAVALAEAEGEELRELVGSAEAVGDAASVADADSEADGVELGSGAATVGSAVTAMLLASVADASVGAAETISPERPVSAASDALLVISLGSDEGDALSEISTLAASLADADALSLALGDTDGDALRDAVAESDAEEEALGEAVIDEVLLGLGEALPIGSTMHGSCGAVTCSVEAGASSAAMATEPVPKVAKMRLAETVIATPPVSRMPLLRAWLRNAKRRERADTNELLMTREWIHSILTRAFRCFAP